MSNTYEQNLAAGRRTEIETRRFYLSHLRQPKGRGSWLFETREGKVVFHFNGTYAEAKKAAIALGTNAGLDVLYTCP
jgi:hypothetical protein